MYKILLFFERLEGNKDMKVINITGMTFSLTRRSQNIRKKTGIRKWMGPVTTREVVTY
jgi:hypothetical protein